MSALERQLAEDRAVRDAARAVFDARMAEVRRALGERSIPQRAADDAKARARSAAEETMTVAEESKWVIVATALALVAWLLRRPLIRSARQLGDRLFATEPASPWERLRDWTRNKVTP